MSLDNVDFRLLQQLLEEQKKTDELLQKISEKIEYFSDYCGDKEVIYEQL